MPKWLKKVGRAGLGFATGGLAGDQNFGLLDNVVRAPRQLSNLWDDASGKTAAEGAAKSQREGLASAQSSTEKMFQDAMDTQKPWLEAGGRGLSQLEAGINSGAFETAPGQYAGPQYQEQAYQSPAAFQDLKFDFEADPGYQFRLSEGNKAVEASAAARGGLFSGATGTDLQNFSQGLASQEYGEAYDRFADQRDYKRGNYESDRLFGRGNFENDRAFGRDRFISDRNFGYGQHMDNYNIDRAGKTDRYNRLASLAGVGQMSAGNIAGQQLEQGNNLANLSMARGNVGAERSMAGYQGGMNLLNTGLQGIALTNSLLNPKKGA